LNVYYTNSFIKSLDDEASDENDFKHREEIKRFPEAIKKNLKKFKLTNIKKSGLEELDKLLKNFDMGFPISDDPIRGYLTGNKKGGIAVAAKKKNELEKLREKNDDDIIKRSLWDTYKDVLTKNEKIDEMLNNEKLVLARAIDKVELIITDAIDENEAQNEDNKETRSY